MYALEYEDYYAGGYVVGTYSNPDDPYNTMTVEEAERIIISNLST